MCKCYHSIFNDVLGPIMTGPSSSHSAGCARIGKMTQILYGKEIRHADIIFDENGSYPSTYIGQGSNFGFTGGLLGYDTDDARLKDAVEIARQKGIVIDFKKASLGLHHPNEARINIFDDQEKVALSVLTYSTGGGMFKIVEMDGFTVMIDGGQRRIYLACLKGETEEIVIKMLNEKNVQYHTTYKDNSVLFCIVPSKNLDESKLTELHKKDNVIFVRVADVVLPVTQRKNSNPPFYNAEQALEYSANTGKDQWELAIDYECGFGEVSPDDVWKKAQHTMEVMRAAAIPPNPKTTPKTGFLDYISENMKSKLKTLNLVDTGLLQQSMLYAIAVMENSCAHNIVVAAPTAGSSGVLPAAIVSIGEQLKLSDDYIIKGLLASGLVGVFIANQATFGAEVAACQAENGAASSMAAAGVVQLLGGTIEQGFMAAGLALQNMLGLVCDPIAGLTEIPCINRNVSAVANAVMCANMVICGYDPVIPLDETISSMLRIGKQLPSELRCTCEGGLCDTPTGRCIAARINATRPVIA